MALELADVRELLAFRQNKPLRGLLDYFKAGSSSELRRRRAAERKTILEGNWRKSVEETIGKRQNQQEFADDLCKHISLAYNPFREITHTLAVVYKLGARRVIGQGQEDFDKLYQEGMVPTSAPRWNRHALSVAPTLVVPRVTAAGKFRPLTIAGCYYEPLLDPDDPLGDPLAVIWSVAQTNTYEKEKTGWVILDRESWHFFDSTGTLQRRTAHGVEDESGEPVFPGSFCRTDHPNDYDWWQDAKNDDLVDGTKDVAYTLARLNKVRKEKDSKFVSLAANIEDIPKGQALNGGEKAFVGDVGPGDRFDLQVHDAVVSPADHMAHIRFIYEGLVEGRGIPAHAVTFDFDSGSEGERMGVTHERLSSIRAEQIPFMRAFETDFAWKSVLVCKVAGHPKALSLDPVKVRDSFRLEVPELNRVGDPIAITQLEDWEQSKGIVSQVDIVMRRYPEMSREQAMKHIMDRVGEMAQVNDLLASRNLSLVDGKIMNASQAFGRQGPDVRDGKRPPPEDSGNGEDNGN